MSSHRDRISLAKKGFIILQKEVFLVGAERKIQAYMILARVEVANTRARIGTLIARSLSQPYNKM